MPREKKDGKHISIKMDEKILEMLNKYCDNNRCSKTGVIELAVEQFINKEMDKNNGERL